MLSAIYERVGFVAEQITPPIVPKLLKFVAKKLAPSDETKIYLLEKSSDFLTRHQDTVYKVAGIVIIHETFKTLLVLNEKLNTCGDSGIDPLGFYTNTECSPITGYPNPVLFFKARVGWIAVSFAVAGVFYEWGKLLTLELAELKDAQTD